MNCRFRAVRGQGSGVSKSSGHSAFRVPRSGFTLTEVLITIGIIVILVSILVPVISGVRKAAKEADVKNQLVVLAGAIQNYYNDHRAYPGPLSNAEIIGGTSDVGAGGVVATQITMSENLVLGLLGGLWNDGGTFTYDWQLVGQGPSNLGMSPKKYSPYIDPVDLTWNMPGYAPGALAGEFEDERNDGAVKNDTIIPEFIDRFSDPLPILYYRALNGAGGIVGAGLQYDVAQNDAYTTSNIGVGRSHPTHGLIVEGDPDNPIVDDTPLDAAPYLRNRALTPDGTLVADGIPHAKDKFILISAGTDRTYGTTDDITSFGNVGE